MTCHIDLLLEKYLGNVRETWKSSDQDQDVFINPDMKEMRELKRGYDEFAIILPNNKDMIAFSRATLHQSVIDQLKIDKHCVSATAYSAYPKLYVSVSDATKRGKWFHNPAIGDFIRSNKYIQRKWKEIIIDYYDDAIVGDWEMDLDD